MLTNEEQNVNIEKYFDYILANALLRAQSEADNVPCDDHQSSFVRQTIEIYLNIRIKLYSKKMVSFKPTNRQKLTKLILFDGN